MMQPYGRPQLVAKLPQSLKNATALRLWNQDFCLRNRSATGHWRRARQPREAAISADALEETRRGSMRAGFLVITY
jgi:hypothetical protein